MARAAALGVAGAGAVLSTGGASASPASRGASGLAFKAEADTLVIAADGSPSDLDPHSAYDVRSAVPIRGIFEPLIGLVGAATDEYEGLIAESWTSNEDKSVWTFTIRDGVTFHDGSPCDAEAVRASFERFLTLGLGAVNVVGRFVSDPSQITAPDANTVVFTLDRPSPIFEAAIASQYGPLVVNAAAAREREAEGDWGHVWAQLDATGMGTGPYHFVQFEPEQQVVLEAYDGYWRGWEGNHFKRIAIRVVPESETRRQLVEQGEADILDVATPEALVSMEANPDLQIDKSYSTEVDYLMLTVANELESPEARQAMCWAFPYVDVVAGVYKGYGKPAVGGVAELCYGFDPNAFQYTTDLDKARELFAAAGLGEGTELNMLVETGNENMKATSELFQASLAECGISLSIELVDVTTMLGIQYGDTPPAERPNVMVNFWWPDYNDAWNHLYPQIATEAFGPNGSNGGGYSNPRVDELLAIAKDAANEEDFLAALSEIQDIISRQDPPAVYYLQRLWPTVLRSDIQNFVFNPIYIGTYDFWRLTRSAQ